MKHLILAGALGLLSLPALVRATEAASFDGAWSVLIVTEQGQCDRAYRYPVNIAGGKVTYGGDAGFNISGSVAANGAATVSVSQGNQAAVGTGRLSGKTGRGTWKAPTGGCSGKWSAERRG
jgi:hypothetical protein